jgi:hypothetical protein
MELKEFAMIRSISKVSVLLAMTLCSTIAAAQEPDHADHEHKFVRITSSKLHPETQQITSTDAIGWVNYSSKIARVSFAREVGKHLTCTSRGSFRLTGDRLESGDIQSRQFASLCRLASGEYSYRVDLNVGIGSSSGGIPSKSFEGKIIVVE